MAKKTMKKSVSNRSKSTKPTKSFRAFVASLRRSPKKALFVLVFALIGTYFVISVLAASLCPPTSNKGTDGQSGNDDTCVASSSNNNCSGADGADNRGNDGADGQGQDVRTSPGSRGSDGASSAPGQPGASSAPSAPSAPSGSISR